ncbi:MAG: exostosin family protein [Bdellovibrionales bacterium]|nr:exostosin family protein [Bdellovibrionales bacterium]
MLKLYIYDRLPDFADSKLLRLFLSENEFEGKIFQNIPTKPFKSMVEFVDAVDEAHYILLPHEYVFIRDEIEYLNELDEFAAKSGKKIIVFDYGDYSDKVILKNSIVLRSASYKSSLSINEIIVPAFIEDLALESNLISLNKTSKVPSVGFAGMVKLPSIQQEIKYQLRILRDKIYIFLNLISRSNLQGLYFRRKVVKILSNCSSCTTNFIIRNSFSAHEKTITSDPKQLRQEYIDVLQSSDLSLVIRGDGNYSLRFFEVLSLGRIPLFIDTDSPLPLESEINYDDFIVRVDHSELNKLPDIIAEFWRGLSPEKYAEMQKTAREIFETQLRPDVFYVNLFKKLEKGSDFIFNLDN